MGKIDAEKLNAALDELEAIEEVTAEAFAESVKLNRDMFTALAAADGPEDPEPGEAEEADPTKPPEPDEAEMPEGVAERFAVLEARAEAAEKVATEERRLRRLGEFAADVTENYSALAIEDAEQMASDLMTLSDADAEAYGRMVAQLKAANEAVKQGDLFKQHSSGRVVTEATGFDARVEQVRAERFNDLPKAEGSVKAMEIVAAENPALFEAYNAAYGQEAQ